MRVELTQSGLTKMIILTPGYVVLNKLPVTLFLSEEGGNEQKVEPEQCNPLWPSRGKDSQLSIRIEGTNDKTPPFQIHSSYSLLLPLLNKVSTFLLQAYPSSSFSSSQPEFVHW